MADPPTGTVTFLFTDIEGSTLLWERDARAMRSALARHDEILRSVIEERGGHVFKTVGDAFCAAFPSAPEALGTAIFANARSTMRSGKKEPRSVYGWRCTREPWMSREATTSSSEATTSGRR